jgi:RNA polymerase sigma factor (TIGR02999 family)
MGEDARPITDLLHRLAQGDREGLDELVSLLYTTLRGMCQSHLGKLPAGVLTPTVLLHELYLDLARRFPDLANRQKFFAYAHAAIEHLAVSALRKEGAAKRGGGSKRVPVEEVEVRDEREGAEAVMLVFEVLARVEAQDPELAAVVKLRVFDGMSERATAEELGISRKKVQRQWTTARSLLAHLLGVEGRTKRGAL